MSRATQGGGSFSGDERRRARRRPILETFQFFCVIPKKGPYRLKVHDLSELGMGFDADLEPESESGFQVAESEELDLLLYVNQSLYIPFRVKVARIETRSGKRKIGAEFRKEGSRGYPALDAFLKMVDALSEI